MTWRATIADALHRLAYRIEPQAWYTPDPTLIQRTDGLGNVEFVRDLGAGTFDVKPTPSEEERAAMREILDQRNRSTPTPITRKRQTRAKAKP